MPSFMDRKPDKMNTTGSDSGAWRKVYHFWYLPPGRKDSEPGVKFVIVTSPNRERIWQVLKISL